MITVTSFRYEGSTRSMVQRGIKNNRTPSRTIRGGNGSYVVAGKKPEIILGIKENENEHSIDYYDFFKEHTHNRITKSYSTDVITKVLGTTYKNQEELDMALISNM